MYRKISLFLIFVTFFQNNNAKEVTIEHGTLKGATFKSRNGNKYHSFLGVPFAKPPIGDLRFEPPQPPESWNGVRDATEIAEMCMQYFNGLGILGDEDCLYLNVHSPADKLGTSPLPVMVFIHGGSFKIGGANMFHPKYFMDHDVIFVAIPYRLHALGFLSTGDDVVPGNNGLKDQVMALKWVQRNIAAFGGDPNRVTLVGSSAGAVAAHLHMFSPLSKGLFHQAILESGSALTLWAHMHSRTAHERAVSLGTMLFCPTEHSRKFVDCMKTVSAEDITLASNKLETWNFGFNAPFSPVSEPDTVKDAFITGPRPCYREELIKVPRIAGFNSNEGLLMLASAVFNDELMLTIAENYKRFLPFEMQFRNCPELDERTDQIIESSKHFYLGNRSISIETWRELGNLISDPIFFYDIMESVKRYMGTKYVYYYDHQNEKSMTQIMGGGEKTHGVCHGDELISLFYIDGVFPEITEGDDFAVSERMVKYWINFVTTGNPDPSGVWTAMKSDVIEALHITTHKDEMKFGLLEDRFQFWRSMNICPI